MLKHFIELVNAYHELSPIRVAVLMDLGRVRVEGGWETFVKGDEASIPLWMALELEKKGLVEIREQRVSDSDVGKHLMVERGLKGGEFQSLKERFYLEARKLLEKIKRKPDLTPDEFFKLVKLESNLADLTRIRLRKIVQISFLGGKPEDFLDKLLLEERVLFIVLRDIIKEWSDEVLRK